MVNPKVEIKSNFVALPEYMNFNSMKNLGSKKKYVILNSPIGPNVSFLFFSHPFG